ncbi:bifunctional glutamate--cysteine ligase GshA/glutathione synthetase GshB [Niameybacter massiliensis]|uniref:Glutathione biosynthesis bifunctional protein GshAB n=1 Tax=Holtiella tumoricola TaxID=3018743 RepID=A0AA42DLB0_9FIRM|nr:bifunctional glutamate--cysteine ligase GshA/glutathione synthetase GshB [Holtiella tumoricola]MDA3731003.1 bifunctional glutamate--cysteine ligase GshA/glutathione synthetase GshB [Holtiella tumoricola]
MMKQIQQVFNTRNFFRGNFGVEREGLRCDDKGHLVYTPHPEVFGEKLLNPYITTDFSESQVELITPVFQSIDETYAFLEGLYDIVAMEIKDEYIWPQSMPCIIPEDNEIPLATFCECKPGQEAYNYRKKLLAKYGGKKQLLSGIHYNFSFDEELIKELYKKATTDKSYRAFRDELYLKVARNYLRYRWLLIYLLGSTSVIHESYVEECVKQLEEVNEESYSNKGALSYRNSECGYTNKVELFPNYDSVEKYIVSVKAFIEESLIESPKELYSQIRLKAHNNKVFLESLQEEGIAYLEYRSIDINPFDKAGIKKDDLYFMHLFNLFLLFKEESEYVNWQEEALQNQRSIARFGQKNITLLKDGESIQKETWGIEILEQIKEIDKVLDLGQEVLIDQMMIKIKDYRQTYAYQIIGAVKKKGYIEAHLDLAKQYKQEAYNNRYKLRGYEDLELSTQILMKEAITRGIKAEIVDRQENFIRLEKGTNIQYVKQATKTSKDNYVTVLMMENKTVTKEVLDRQGIKVPKGTCFDSLEQALQAIQGFVNKPIVIKPKSTNFGIGISIFPEGGVKDDLEQAVRIAFLHDQTVLIEEFIAGKEYRFLVVDDQVVGILHRVPANVKGDGLHSIGELVEIKNQNPLRGKGYKTPLEKINLDESAGLFLKQRGMNFESIPSKGEVIYLRENSNISTGGDSIDYTDVIPDYYKRIAVESAKAIGARICGVDMMIEDYKCEDNKYAIIELNFNPAIHIHSYPSKGIERKIASKVIELLGY